MLTLTEHNAKNKQTHHSMCVQISDGTTAKQTVRKHG